MSSASAIIRVLSVGSSSRSGGGRNVQLSVPASEMKPRLRLGPANAGPCLKKCLRERRIIVFVDEAAFYLLAGVVRTYALRGQTPVLRVPLTRDHLSVISGITLQGQLLTGMQESAFKGPDLVQFLRHLLRRLGGKLLVIWDGL